MKTAYFFMPGLLCLPLLVAAADTIPQDSVTVLGRTLQLVADNGQCILHYQAKGENRSIALKPAPPCFFLRHDKTRPQHFAYPGRMKKIFGHLPTKKSKPPPVPETILGIESKCSRFGPQTVALAFDYQLRKSYRLSSKHRQMRQCFRKFIHQSDQ